MKKIVSALVCSLVAVLAVGCGSSRDHHHVPQPTPGPGAPTGDLRILLSAAELAELFPAPVAQALEDPSIVEYRVFAYDAAGNLVTQVSQARVPGSSLDILLTGLQLLHFDVIVAGVDSTGELVGASASEDVVPVQNAVLEITREAFAPIDGFVLPDPDDGGDLGPVEGDEVLDVSVAADNGLYRVSWDGEGGTEPILLLSAIPLDLIDDVLDANMDPESAKRMYSAVSLTDADTLAQPFLLTNGSQEGVYYNPAFEGFDGSEYRVTVTRENGDFGYIDVVLGE